MVSLIMKYAYAICSKYTNSYNKATINNYETLPTNLLQLMTLAVFVSDNAEKS